MSVDKSRFIDEICQQILTKLPSQFFSLQHDLQLTIKEVIRQTLQKFELVTRDEFDTQNKVLKRTQAKLLELEKQIAELEELAKNKSK